MKTTSGIRRLPKRATTNKNVGESTVAASFRPRILVIVRGSSDTVSTQDVAFFLSAIMESFINARRLLGVKPNE
jgi:hypothetical protein